MSTSGEQPSRVAQSSDAPRSAAVALWTLVALAVASPWPFGSATPGAVRALSSLSLATTLGVAFHQAWRGALWRPRLPMWPLATLLAVGLMQLAPLPAGLHQVVAPGSAAVWHPTEPAAAAVLDARARPLSIHPAATCEWLGMAGGLLGLALLGVPALGRRSRLTRVTWVLVAAGTAVAVYGVVARSAFGSLLYGSIVVPTVAPFGPFVNKNHFAGYVEMPALLALGLGRGLWRQAAGAGDAVPSPSPAAIVAFGAAAAMILAVLLSMSRGGALGIVSGIATFAVVDAMTSRHRGRIGKVMVPIGLAAVLATVVALLPGEVHDRLFMVRRDDSSAVFRVEIWKDSLRAWRASPLLGQGLGAFADVLPRFKTTAGLFRVEHPENEPIEIAVEGGLVALGAAATALVGGLVLAVRGIRGHRDRVLRGIVTGAVAGAAGLTVHGLVDFNLRIPSNATLFVVLMALAVAPLGSSPLRGRGRWGLVAALAALAIASARQADAWPILREARAAAVKASQRDRTAPAALRLSMADRLVRHYLGRRPADPEGWLLAAWAAAAKGRPADAAALAGHAVTLDPQRPGLSEIAREFREALPNR